MLSLFFTLTSDGKMNTKCLLIVFQLQAFFYAALSWKWITNNFCRQSSKYYNSCSCFILFASERGEEEAEHDNRDEELKMHLITNNKQKSRLHTQFDNYKNISWLRFYCPRCLFDCALQKCNNCWNSTAFENATGAIRNY